MKKNKERIFLIDNLRGISIIAMMIVHAASYFLRDKTTYFIWDNLEWVVPVFIFCFFYVLLEKEIYRNNINWFDYFKKRLKRLLIPYFVFLFFYFLIVYFFDFKKFNLNYFLSNIFLYGGLDFNWLVLLFVYFTFLTPVFFKIIKNNFLKIAYFILIILSSIFFIFYKINYRLIMWLPWSFYLYLIPLFQKKDNKKILLITLLSFFLFLFLRFFELNIGHNLSQFSNKYPPTLYHLVFGSFWIGVLYFLLRKKEIKILNFFSVNSYSLYFIHIMVLYLSVYFKIIPSNWFLFFLQIFIPTVLIQKLLNFFNRLFL